MPLQMRATQEITKFCATAINVAGAATNVAGAVYSNGQNAESSSENCKHKVTYCGWDNISRTTISQCTRMCFYKSANFVPNTLWLKTWPTVSLTQSNYYCHGHGGNSSNIRDSATCSAKQLDVNLDFSVSKFGTWASTIPRDSDCMCQSDTP